MSQNVEPVAKRLASILARVSFERATSRARETAKMLVLDTIGVTLAGAVEPAVRILLSTVSPLSSSGPSLAIGNRRRIGILDAALVNGTAAHAIDFDDMAEAMGGHPSVPVVPVVFALGEGLNASGRDVLDAYIVGFEAECRIGRMVHPHHYTSGWHPTATLGVFGAAAAAARLLRLNEDATALALATAASSASGVKSNFGTMTKPLHVGNSARSGLLAAVLARNGFTANPFVFEAKEGFFRSFDGLENVDAERGLDPSLDVLEVERDNVGLKQFSCCGSTHPSILAMLALVEDVDCTASDVAAIEIFTHPRRLPHTDNPFPKTSLGAKFSIQYVVTRALLDGAVRLAHFEGDAYREREVLELLSRTTVSPFPESSPLVGQEMAAEVIVTTTDGRRLSARSQNALGRGPLNPMSPEEMWEKFSDCASLALDRPQVAEAFNTLRSLDEVSSLASLSEHLTGYRLERSTDRQAPAESGRILV